MNRYEARLQRTDQRALRNLATLRAPPQPSKKPKIAIGPT